MTVKCDYHFQCIVLLNKKGLVTGQGIFPPTAPCHIMHLVPLSPCKPCHLLYLVTQYSLSPTVPCHLMYIFTLSLFVPCHLMYLSRQFHKVLQSKHLSSSLSIKYSYFLIINETYIYQENWVLSSHIANKGMIICKTVDRTHQH